MVVLGAGEHLNANTCIFKALGSVTQLYPRGHFFLENVLNNIYWIKVSHFYNFFCQYMYIGDSTNIGHVAYMWK